MKGKVYIASYNTVSPLGFTAKDNFKRLMLGDTGVVKAVYPNLSNENALCAAIIDDKALELEFNKLGITGLFTRLEKMLIVSVHDALKSNPSIDPKSRNTLFILSSTKGNIELLDNSKAHIFGKDRIYLWKTASIVSSFFGNVNTPLVISNACISGVVALIAGKRLLESGPYDTIIVFGGDQVTEFVVSGFESFKAISPEVCKPYDLHRDGISLGEGASTVVLTNDSSKLNGNPERYLVLGGASSNDANHISGPSRTGDGLLIAMQNAMSEAGIKSEDIDFVSGHGTATPYNDEMESLALADAGLSTTPLNSMKGYFGHTLGAAGLIESVMTLESMKNNRLIPSFNFTEVGTSRPMNIIRESKDTQIEISMKNAAGFGGCNASILFGKEKDQS